MNVRQTGKN
jgi:hypothetical protein